MPGRPLFAIDVRSGVVDDHELPVVVALLQRWSEPDWSLVVSRSVGRRHGVAGPGTCREGGRS